jgi:hypothetical protein
LNVRLDVDPPIVLPKPEPVPDLPTEGPSDPSDPSAPLDPLDPEEPQTPEETDPSAPLEVGTLGPVKPTVAATKGVPTASVTDKALTATPKNSDKPTAPQATAAAGSDDDEITSSSPGGLSGDNSKDAGGFGDGPDDVNCPLGTRGLFGLQRRCSRGNRPDDWTAYDDIKANKPDTARDALNTAIQNKLPDKVAVDFETAYTDGRKSVSTFNKLFSSKITDKQEEDDFFISIAGTSFQKTELKNTGPPTDRAINQVFNTLSISGDGKVMIADYSMADKDNTKTLRWSEIAFQRRKAYPAGTDMTKLESIVRIEVNNAGTLNTARQAFSELGKTFADGEEKLILHANAAAGSAEKAAFDAMLRTDNVRGVNWMLGDHHQAFGDKQITTLTIWPDNSNCAILISIG